MLSKGSKIWDISRTTCAKKYLEIIEARLFNQFSYEKRKASKKYF